MEQLAIPADVMRRRVEETLDLLGIAELRARPMRMLSGGQQQRVAIGSVLTAHPRVLVLDEPTSALDPTAAEEVLAAITRLVHDLGVTVVIAEHRMERVVQYADRVLHLPGDGSARSGPPAEILAGSEIAPPIVHLGRLAGWDPLPLSVRDARRLAEPMRTELAGRTPPTRPAPTGSARADRRAHRGSVRRRRGRAGGEPRPAGWADRGGDGPQRLGQVLAPVGPPGIRAAPRRDRPGRRRGPEPAPAVGGPRPGRARAPDPRRPPVPRDRRRGVRPGRRRGGGRGRHLPRPPRPARPRPARRPPPPRPLGGPAPRARAGGAALAPPRGWCCSTSRRGGSTTAPRTACGRCCARSPTRAGPSWWPPTTSSSWPRPPTT